MIPGGRGCSAIVRGRAAKGGREGGRERPKRPARCAPALRAICSQEPMPKASALHRPWARPVRHAPAGATHAQAPAPARLAPTRKRPVCVRARKRPRPRSPAPHPRAPAPRTPRPCAPAKRPGRATFTARPGQWLLTRSPKASPRAALRSSCGRTPRRASDRDSCR